MTITVDLVHQVLVREGFAVLTFSRENDILRHGH